MSDRIVNSFDCRDLGRSLSLMSRAPNDDLTLFFHCCVTRRLAALGLPGASPQDIEDAADALIEFAPEPMPDPHLYAVAWRSACGDVADADDVGQPQFIVPPLSQVFWVLCGAAVAYLLALEMRLGH